MNLEGLDPVIIAPALAAGMLVTATHVPLGQQVLKRGIIFIDLAIAQIAALGVVIAHTAGIESLAGTQLTAFGSALGGAALLYSFERRGFQNLEAIIGMVFVLAATAGILLLAGNPHAGDYLQELLVGQILWVEPHQLLAVLVINVIVLAAWFGLHAEERPPLFYGLFAVSITASVQLVGVYLVFATLIVPALAARRLTRRCQSLMTGYLLGIAGFTLGLVISALYDLPSGAVIVWSLAVLGILASVLIRSGDTETDEVRRS